MISYLTVTFSTEGSKPSEIAARLESLGFTPTTGNYDFVYKWDRRAKVEDALWLADKVQVALRGMNVLFKLETAQGNEREIP
jgi:hypothetical protein